MSKLIYITNTSLDGYIEDATGNFDWPSSDQLFGFFTELLRPIGTLLYGRRLYEKMAYWGASVEDYAPEHRAFAQVWQRPAKIVFSRTLSTPMTHNTKILRDLDGEAIRGLKLASSQDMTIGGAELASVALEANLVDECHLIVHPIVVGGGKPAFHTTSRRNFELLETRRFDTGAVHLRYRVPGG